MSEDRCQAQTQPLVVYHPSRSRVLALQRQTTRILGLIAAAAAGRCSRPTSLQGCQPVPRRRLVSQGRRQPMGRCWIAEAVEHAMPTRAAPRASADSASRRPLRSLWWSPSVGSTVGRTDYSIHTNAGCAPTGFKGTRGLRAGLCNGLFSLGPGRRSNTLRRKHAKAQASASNAAGTENGSSGIDMSMLPTFYLA